ncbi:MAG TPA: DUF1684 domain-containing protein [Ferruginibacter sp.]|nr:DUF1684 domain-containing protein [Ferruginibacter sp.]
MHKFFALLTILLISQTSFTQKDFYTESIKAYQKKYVDSHEVVKKNDKRYFRFYPVSKTYNVICRFEKITDTIGFTMKTSANTFKHYFKYGNLSFTIAGKELKLFVYQSKDLMKTERYKDYLFVPFTDLTTGDQSYGSGRYLEFYKQDIQNDRLQLDFNKAYNPYCAYSPGYKCPIPPKENALPVAVKAGEMNFAKPH